MFLFKKYSFIFIYLLSGCAIIILAARCVSPVIFPDELSFLETGIIHADHILMPNSFGYGSLWWELVRFSLWVTASLHLVMPKLTVPSISDPTLTPLDLLRIYSAFALAAPIFYAGFTAQNRNNGLLTVLMLLVLPLTWWNGRWAAPDFFGVGTAIMAATFWVSGKNKASAIFIGMSSAFRLSNGISLIGFIIFPLIKNNVDWRHRLSMSALFFTVGYLIGNPFILLHPVDALRNMVGVSSENHFKLHEYLNLFNELTYGNRMEWDLPYVGSVTHWFGGSISLICFLILSTVNSETRRAFTALFVGLSLCIFAILFRQLGYGWYFMPVIASSITALSLIMNTEYCNVIKKLVIYLSVTIFLLNSGVTSLLENRENFNRADQLRKTQDQVACINEAVSRRPHGQRLLLGLDPAISFLPLNDDSIVDMHEIILLDDNSISQNDWLAFSTYMFNHSPRIRKIANGLRDMANVVQCGSVSIFSPR